MTINSRFIAQRLKNSSFAELLSRFRQMLEVSLLKEQVRSKCLRPQSTVIKKAQLESLKMPKLLLDDNDQFVQALKKKQTIQTTNSWPIDIKTSTSDIRVRWEAARLQQATLLMVIASKSDNPDDSERFNKTAKTIVLDWIQDNPFLCGEHYISAMECALRIPVFFYLLKRVECLTSNELFSVLDTVCMHALLISKKLSLFSSRGNHTIAEAAGLVFAGAIFRMTRRGQNWLKIGIKLLNDELPHQVLCDGGPAEQSVGYHRFVLDLYWLALDFIQKNDLGKVTQWEERLELGEYFLNMLGGQARGCASIGDSDNGFAIAQGLKPLRTSGENFDDKKTTVFKVSGYSIMNRSRYALIFDHGPLGMPPLHNHGHADALAIWLSYQGKPFLVDSGTYRYNGVPRWRRYFKGTQAHNTVTIDNKDQAVQETSFIWSNAYSGQIDAFVENEQLLFWSASHDGYTRQHNPVRHHRSILFEKDRHLLIRDYFQGSGEHHFQINYHLHPNVTVQNDGKWLRLSHGETFLFLRIREGEFLIKRGLSNPILGWYSEHYGKKQPTTILTFSKTGRPEGVNFTTAIFSRLPN